ncbi:basic salivary proline-rich protein 2-like [Physella acuta]|uniref:basic salivary proline-rich protein 2-like n=1 Tax=Physella acuta TaxID=109671 RepID=UPI0027DCDF6F|nr:basic salivary proline-rich protein 2-like [Physella acuta]
MFLVLACFSLVAAQPLPQYLMSMASKSFLPQSGYQNLIPGSMDPFTSTFLRSPMAQELFDLDPAPPPGSEKAAKQAAAAAAATPGQGDALLPGDIGGGFFSPPQTGNRFFTSPSQFDLGPTKSFPSANEPGMFRLTSVFGTPPSAAGGLYTSPLASNTGGLPGATSPNSQGSDPPPGAGMFGSTGQFGSPTPPNSFPQTGNTMFPSAQNYQPQQYSTGNGGSPGISPPGGAAFGSPASGMYELAPNSTGFPAGGGSEPQPWTQPTTPQGGGFSYTPQQGGQFYSPPQQPQNSGSNFGQPQNSGGNYGQPQPQNSGTNYGQPQNSGGNYGQPQNSGGNYGQPQPQNSGTNYGQPQNSGGNYGQPQPQNSGGNFGQPQNSGSNYGQPQNSGGNYGPPYRSDANGPYQGASQQPYMGQPTQPISQPISQPGQQNPGMSQQQPQYNSNGYDQRPPPQQQYSSNTYDPRQQQPQFAPNNYQQQPYTNTQPQPGAYNGNQQNGGYSYQPPQTGSGPNTNFQQNPGLERYGYSDPRPQAPSSYTPPVYQPPAPPAQPPAQPPPDSFGFDIKTINMFRTAMGKDKIELPNSPLFSFAAMSRQPRTDGLTGSAAARPPASQNLMDRVMALGAMGTVELF